MIGRRYAALACVLALASGCGAGDSEPTATPGAPTSRTTPPPTATPPPATHHTPAKTPAATARPAHHPRAEPRFWVKDRTFYTSPWFAGAHQIMIGFGCTRAPYYDPDPSCPASRGSHHGIDVAMPCGTKLTAGLAGTVVPPDSPGVLGDAYGPWAFRVRGERKGVDVVIGHVRNVFVHPGERVRRGSRIARANDAGAPDGCHLHFEVRPIGGSVSDAVNPRRLLHLTPAR